MTEVDDLRSRVELLEGQLARALRRLDEVGATVGSFEGRGLGEFLRGRGISRLEVGEANIENTLTMGTDGEIILGTGAQITDQDGSLWDDSGLVLATGGAMGDTITWKNGTNYKGSVYADTSYIWLRYASTTSREPSPVTDAWAWLKLGSSDFELGYGSGPTASYDPDGWSGTNGVGIKVDGSGDLRITKPTAGMVITDGIGGFEPQSATISGGVITASTSYIKIDTESAAASDDLDTINVGNALTGAFIIVQAADTTHTVVLKNGTGNIQTNAILGDISLSDTEAVAMLVYNGTNWCVV